MKPESKRRRRGGEKRKTGCQKCKARHIRCDEKLPMCNNCKRLGLECRPTNIILHSTWSSIAPAIQLGSSSRNDERQVFVRSATPLNTRVAAQSSVALLTLTDEVVQLLRLYNTQLALWMDLCDHGCTYQREVGRLATQSELILKCICAFSAQHLSLLASGSHWQPVASHYYGEALALLIQELGTLQPQAYALAAAVLLGSYEVVAAHGHEHRRHLQGALRLIRLRGIDAQSVGLDGASFWIYVRHELFIALSNEKPLQLCPEDWAVGWPEAGDAEDGIANHVLWLAARTINATYGECDQKDWQCLKDDITRWYDATPITFRGVAYGQPDRDGLRRVYFSSPAAAAAMMWYHLLSLLLLIAPGKTVPASACPMIQNHATLILCIGISDIPPSVRCFSTLPILFAGKHISGVEKRIRAWILLDDIEKELGYDTSKRVELMGEMSATPLHDSMKGRSGESGRINIV